MMTGTPMTTPTPLDRLNLTEHNPSKRHACKVFILADQGVLQTFWHRWLGRGKRWVSRGRWASHTRLRAPNHGTMSSGDGHAPRSVE